MIRSFRFACMVLIVVFVGSFFPYSPFGTSNPYVSNALDSGNENDSVKLLLKGSDNLTSDVKIFYTQNDNRVWTYDEYNVTKVFERVGDGALLTIKGLDWKYNDTYNIWVFDGKSLYYSIVKKEDLNVLKTVSNESYIPLKINTLSLGDNVG
ncbi:MAG: hypothetical protein Q8942_16140, partial [Bacillota bacterium]|nr:hypothetical protein [Bacillota bacterium]